MSPVDDRQTGMPSSVQWKNCGGVEIVGVVIDARAYRCDDCSEATSRVVVSKSQKFRVQLRIESVISKQRLKT